MLIEIVSNTLNTTISIKQKGDNMRINLYQKYWDTFVRNIVWLRKHYKISKKRMAEILGVTTDTLTKIEHYEMPDEVTVEILIKAEKFFGILIYDLLTCYICD